MIECKIFIKATFTESYLLATHKFVLHVKAVSHEIQIWITKPPVKAAASVEIAKYQTTTYVNHFMFILQFGNKCESVFANENGDLQALF